MEQLSREPCSKGTKNLVKEKAYKKWQDKLRLFSVDRTLTHPMKEEERSILT